MQRNAKAFLFDAIRSSNLVLEFCTGRTLSDYLDDVLLRSAVERQLFIVGEAISQLRQVAPEVFEQLSDARSIVGFRNILAHAYGEIDDRRVWDLIETDLVRTLHELEQLYNSQRLP